MKGKVTTAMEAKFIWKLFEHISYFMY